MSKKIEVPFAPGDDLYYINIEAKDTDGPALIEIVKDPAGIPAVLVSADGSVGIVPETGGGAEPPGGPWNCLTEQDAWDWARENCPGAVILDRKAVKAVYTGYDQVPSEITFPGGMSDIDGFVPGTVATSEPDPYGVIAVYGKNASRNDSGFVTFVKDSRGEPVDAIYGPFLLIGTEIDKETGLRRLKDVPEAILAAAAQARAGQESCADRTDAPPAYDPDAWAVGQDMSIKELKAFLDRFPDDAVVHCCGATPVYMHYAPATKALSFDCEDLSYLPEYEGREPKPAGGQDT